LSHTPVRLYERLDCCDHCISRRNNTSARSFSSTPSRPWANFSRQMCIAALVKHLSPNTGCISEWMAFGQSPFARRKGITERCYLRDAYNGNGTSPYLSLWRHSDAIVIQAAKLSQRDRAAGCASFGQKWKTGTKKQYFADIIGRFQ